MIEFLELVRLNGKEIIHTYNINIPEDTKIRRTQIKIHIVGSISIKILFEAFLETIIVPIKKTYFLQKLVKGKEEKKKKLS